MPSRTPAGARLSGSTDQRAEPHAEQNALPKPSGGSKTLTSSSPETMRSDPGTILADGAAPQPDRRWHLVQWQYDAKSGGSVTS